MNDPIKAFESDVEILVRSFQQYAPNQACSSALIKDSDRIGSQISERRNKLDQHASSDLSQKRKDDQLTSSLFEILQTLVECKRNLDNLPKLHDYTTTNDSNPTLSKDEEFKTEDTKTVLSYALKLSKFSKIPRTFDGMLLPNNFTWPGDDNMRRGNLAIASMMPDKLIQYENYGPGYVPPEEKMEIDGGEEDKTSNSAQGVENTKKPRHGDEEDEEDEDEDDFIPERTSSIENVNRGESTAVMTGLDLLDSDDE